MNATADARFGHAAQSSVLSLLPRHIIIAKLEKIMVSACRLLGPSSSEACLRATDIATSEYPNIQTGIKKLDSRRPRNSCLREPSGRRADLDRK